MRLILVLTPLLQRPLQKLLAGLEQSHVQRWPNSPVIRETSVISMKPSGGSGATL